VQVAARDSTSIPFKVDSDNMQLVRKTFFVLSFFLKKKKQAYEFSSVDYDIEFSVVRVENGKESSIERNKRYDAHVEPVSGIISKLKAGEYKVMCFLLWALLFLNCCAFPSFLQRWSSTTPILGRLQSKCR
jgi:hypothetical protein